MEGMNMSPPSEAATANGHSHEMMMHMSFFWGKDAIVLFTGFPGTKGLGVYVASLVLVLVLAFIAESLSAVSRRLSHSSRLLHALAHALRVGTAYLVMLAVMSFNGGVFIAAVVGHFLGFLCFRGKPGSANDYAAC